MNRLAFFFVIICYGAAQDQPSGRIQFDWDKLAAKAVEKVDVNLEAPMLEMASKFLGDKGDDAKVKQVIQGLKGVYVKSFTFDKEGQYSEADLNAIRSQLRAPEWSRIVDIQEKGETSSVFMKTDGKQTRGIVILAAEPKELTFVEIVGPIDPSMLSNLGGNLGIPTMHIGPKAKPKPATKKDD
jgi:Domain of unknown function (DUF4252)